MRFGVRVPPPSTSAVTKMLGVDPKDVEEKDNNIMSKEPTGDQQYCMRVVAHRGAGFDYPENSMSAFRNVSNMVLNYSNLL